MPAASITRLCSLGAIALAMLPGLPVLSAPEIGPNGFLVKFDVSISAPPAKVYDALVAHVGSWWNPEHTYSHDAKNLSIDPRPEGCFCEKLPNGGGIEHLRVVYVAPPQIIRFSGALGPLQTSGVVGSMTWKLTGAADTTRLELSYGVGGFIPGGFDKMAPAVEAMLREQFDRLKLFVETGKPAKIE